MLLSDLKRNQDAMIVSLRYPQANVRVRLLEMGLTPGTLLKVSKIAPLGDPIGVVFRGYELCISKKEASYIWVEVVK